MTNNKPDVKTCYNCKRKSLAVMALVSDHPNHDFITVTRFYCLDCYRKMEFPD